VKKKNVNICDKRSLKENKQRTGWVWMSGTTVAVDWLDDILTPLG